MLVTICAWYHHDHFAVNGNILSSSMRWLKLGQHLPSRAKFWPEKIGQPMSKYTMIISWWIIPSFFVDKHLNDPRWNPFYHNPKVFVIKDFILSTRHCTSERFIQYKAYIILSILKYLTILLGDLWLWLLALDDWHIWPHIHFSERRQGAYNTSYTVIAACLIHLLRTVRESAEVLMITYDKSHWQKPHGIILSFLKKI